MDLEQIFREATQDDPLYHTAIDLVRANSRGKIWLMGGFIYRTLAKELYGTPFEVKDYDFIVEEVKVSGLSSEVEVRKNSFGNPKLLTCDFEVDVVPIERIKFPSLPNVPNTIEYFLQGTPFTVQSFAYDLDTQKLVGEIGKSALLEKVVRINCLPEAENLAVIRGKSVEEMLVTLARSLNFGYEL